MVTLLEKGEALSDGVRRVEEGRWPILRTIGERRSVRVNPIARLDEVSGSVTRDTTEIVDQAGKEIHRLASGASGSG